MTGSIWLMKPFTLAEHVFCAVHDEHGVVLDARTGKYTVFDVTQMSAAASLVEGWPAFSAGKTLKPVSAEQALAKLRQREWVTETGPTQGTRRPMITPHAELGSIDPTGPVGWYPALSYVRSALHAKLMAKALRPCKLIARIRARRGSGAPDPVRTRELVERFVRARAYLFSIKNECYYDSLALLEFLARFAIYPDWVLAVRTRPFAAHCWVQQEGLVLNDTLARAKAFTPIVRV